MSEPAPASSTSYHALLRIENPPPPVPSADSVPRAVALDSSVPSADTVPPAVAQDSTYPPGPPNKPTAATPPLPSSNSPAPPSRTSATSPPPLLPPLSPPPQPPPPSSLSPPLVSPPPPPTKTKVSVPPPHYTPPPLTPPPAPSTPLISPTDLNAPPPSPIPASVPPPPISKIVPPPPPDGKGLLAPPPPVLIIPPSSPTPPPPISPPSTSAISTPPPVNPTHSTTPSDALSARSSPRLAHSKYSSRALSSNSSNSKEATALVGVTISMVVVAFVAIHFLILRKKKSRRINGFPGRYRDPASEMLPSNANLGPNNVLPPGGESPYGRLLYTPEAIDPPGSKSWFSYEELQRITNRFSCENHVGEGGFGSVYKGVLPDGRQVAVKQLRSGSGQGDREFKAEVEIISRVHHRHLVSLVGYCIAQHHRLLVYEYVPNKTLHHHLHGEGLPVLDWVKRMRIAIGSARGLAYLHEDCHPRIIHRDIKSANILLDEVFEAQVADFGLAKLANDTHTHVSTRVMGTFGYLAPEYASSGKLTSRSDVYSFGVVLLELITGRKPVDASLSSEDESLVEWARPLLVHALETGNFEELVDPKLENNFSRLQMLRMIEAAAGCVRHSAPKRPRMLQVLRALDDDGSQSDLSNGVKFGQSTIYDSTQYSADIQELRMVFDSGDNCSIDYDDSGEYDHRSVNSATIVNAR